MRTHLLTTLGIFVVMGSAPSLARAQSLGTFSWQLQPYCNVVSVSVIQQGAVYTLDGYDDQCGAAQRAPLVGIATPNPDGTIGLGLNIVTVPGGRGVQVEARITLTTLGGPWTDGAGNSGTFVFGASTGGSPRPVPTTGGGTTIPPTFALLTDGGFLAGGTINVGTIPASGSGTRMMWHPRRAAFRAGNVTGTTWDDVNVGNESVAFNKNTTASGVFSAAFGDSTIASGQTSTAMRLLHHRRWRKKHGDGLRHHRRQPGQHRDGLPNDGQRHLQHVDGLSDRGQRRHELRRWVR